MVVVVVVVVANVLRADAKRFATHGYTNEQDKPRKTNKQANQRQLQNMNTTHVRLTNRVRPPCKERIDMTMQQSCTDGLVDETAMPQFEGLDEMKLKKRVTFDDGKKELEKLLRVIHCVH